MKTTRLWLVRHLKPAVAEGICYGQTDLPLLAAASAQLEMIDSIRQQLPPAAPVFTSPLQRCAELAAALHASPQFEPRLQELCFGDWEMRHWDAIGSVTLDAWAENLAGFRPPAGETGYELQKRVLAWLRETCLQYDTMIVVTHAGVMRVLQAHQQMLPGAAWLNLHYDYGQVVCLELTHEQIHAAPVQ